MESRWCYPGRMKLAALAPVVVTLATALITGCGPGLTTQALRANAPTDAKLAMDATLSQELIGTTSLTSASLPLPETRGSLAAASSAPSAPTEPVAAPARTWGADPEQDPNFNPEYGF
jgi:hypothetical protein